MQWTIHTAKPRNVGIHLNLVGPVAVGVTQISIPIQVEICATAYSGETNARRPPDRLNIERNVYLYLYFIVLYCNVLCCIVLYNRPVSTMKNQQGFVMKKRKVYLYLYFIVLYCNVLCCIVLYRIVLYCIGIVLHRIVLHRIVLYRIIFVLYCVVLYCIVL